MTKQKCIHHWFIDSKEVGTCLKCQQVKDFRRLQPHNDLIQKARKGGAQWS